uniref:DUF2029 domain-containing protein n=1 Tax=Ignisphaera aggregans TaxID=334771 RepID=A0A7C2V8N7_9CREN
MTCCGGLQWYNIVETHGIGGLINIYSLCSYPECKAPYPPLAILIFLPVYALANLVPVQWRVILLKLVLVMGPGLAIYRVLKKYRGSRIALLWLASIPFIQILFALQYDVLLAFFVLMSTVMLAEKKVDKAALFLGLASMIKHVALILLPLHVLYLWLSRNTKMLYRYIAILVAAVGCIALPFFVVSPIDFLQHVVFFHSSRAPQDLSLWALPTHLLGEEVVEVVSVLGGLWAAFFLVGYALILFMFYHQVLCCSSCPREKLLAAYTSVVLLLFIALNKVGNLNYVVWFVPAAFMAFEEKHIAKIYKMTAALGLTGALFYAFMLYVPPAAVNQPILVVEDLVQWNARALIAQSLNYYVFAISSLVYRPFTYIMEPLYSPTDFVSDITIFKMLYSARSVAMVGAILTTQVIMTVLIIKKIRWIKEYILSAVQRKQLN